MKLMLLHSSITALVLHVVALPCWMVPAPAVFFLQKQLAAAAAPHLMPCCLRLLYAAGMGPGFGAPQASSLPPFPPLPQASRGTCMACVLHPCLLRRLRLCASLCPWLYQASPFLTNHVLVLTTCPALATLASRSACATPPQCCAWPVRHPSPCLPTQPAQQTRLLPRAAAARLQARPPAHSLAALVRSRLPPDGLMRF